MICKACGTAHTTVLPGNGWIELTMWVLIPLWPAALISFEAAEAFVQARKTFNQNRRMQ